jgi:hypothetical protein
MRHYAGVRLDAGAVITVSDDGKAIRLLEHIVKHSPTGMGWGYLGSGPSDLALSILTDYYRNLEVPAPAAMAERYYKRFEQRVVAWLAYPGWRLSAAEIANLIAQIAEEAEWRNGVEEDS